MTDMVEVVARVSFRQGPTITHGQKHELHVDDREPAGTNQGRKLLSADPFKLIPFIEVPMIMPVLMSANCKAQVGFRRVLIMRGDIVLELAPEQYFLDDPVLVLCVPKPQALRVLAA
jgi:hypothetical protein